MDKNLIGLLANGSKLVNLYTGDVYKFLEQEGDTQFIRAILQSEEKWNKYKMVYEDVPEKEMRVDSAELVPGDKIPFISVKGKKLFDVRNMDIVTYTRNKETIKARVVYLDGGNEDKDTVFTFVGQDGKDISDTGKGYTAEQFANDFNKKKKAVKRIVVEDGFFAEKDTRFNLAEIAEKAPKIEATTSTVVTTKKAYKPLNISGLRNRLKKLGFYCKDQTAFTKLSFWDMKVKKKKEIAVTEQLLILFNSSDESKLDELRMNDPALYEQVIEIRNNKLEQYKFIEAYNVVKQLLIQETKQNCQVELANIKRKASIDVTDEEKAYTSTNIVRIEKQIEECDKKLDELNGFRKTILEDYNKELEAVKAIKDARKKTGHNKGGLFSAKNKKNVA